jgi:hypothetical protein
MRNFHLPLAHLLTFLHLLTACDETAAIQTLRHHAQEARQWGWAIVGALPYASIARLYGCVYSGLAREWLSSRGEASATTQPVAVTLSLSPQNEGSAAAGGAGVCVAITVPEQQRAAPEPGRNGAANWVAARDGVRDGGSSAGDTSTHSALAQGEPLLEALLAGDQALQIVGAV